MYRGAIKENWGLVAMESWIRWKRYSAATVKLYFPPPSRLQKSVNYKLLLVEWYKGWICSTSSNRVSLKSWLLPKNASPRTHRLIIGVGEIWIVPLVRLASPTHMLFRQTWRDEIYVNLQWDRVYWVHQWLLLLQVDPAQWRASCLQYSTCL